MSFEHESIVQQRRRRHQNEIQSPEPNWPLRNVRKNANTGHKVCHGERIAAPGDRRATKGFTTRSVRDHGVDAICFDGLYQAVRSRI